MHHEHAVLYCDLTSNAGHLTATLQPGHEASQQQSPITLNSATLVCRLRKEVIHRGWQSVFFIITQYLPYPNCAAIMILCCTRAEPFGATMLTGLP